jgi:tetratricopeptide (TPR) repeat protein
MSALLSPGSPEQTLAICSDLLAELARANSTFDTSTTFTAAYDRLSLLPEDHTSEPLVECLLLVAQYYYLDARPTLSLGSAARAVGAARRLGHLKLLRKSLTFLGVMLMETGSLPGATEAYSEALEIARRIGDKGTEAPVWNNLGIALQNAAQYDDAVQCFERAASLAQSSSEFAFVEKQALSNLAECALHVHNVKTGVKAVRRAIELNPQPETSPTVCASRV